MIRVYGPDHLRPYMRPWPGSLYNVQRISYAGGGAFCIRMATPRSVDVHAVASILRDMQATVSLGAAAPLEVFCLDTSLLQSEDPAMGRAEGIRQPGWLALSGHVEEAELLDLVTHEVTHALAIAAIDAGEQAALFAIIGQMPGSNDDQDWARRPQEIVAEVLSHALWGQPIRQDMAAALNLSADQVARVRDWAMQQFGSHPPTPIVIDGEVAQPEPVKPAEEVKTVVPDWRSIPGLMALAEKAARNGLSFSQAKFERLWQIAEAAGVPPLLLIAILPQEGTGSFNTSAENRAADGGHGVEADWERDIKAAVDLVAGKMALWVQACAQGWTALAKQVKSPGWGANARQSDGGPIEWVNWSTAILRPTGRVDLGCYAQHASWWLGVRANYLSYGGTIAQLEEAARTLDRRAPRVAMEFRLARNTGEASNSTATVPEPAAICTAARIMAPPAPVDKPKPGGIRPVRIHLLNGETVMGELRGQTTWIPVGDTWLPVRVVAKSLGAVVEASGFEGDFSKARVDILTPARATPV